MADRGLVIVGAGPAGLLVALRSDSDAVVLSASRRPGWPPHCTGLVSPQTAKVFGASEAVKESYREAVFLGPKLREICRVEGKPLAVRLARPLLEELLAAEAESRGVKFVRGVHVAEVTGNCAVAISGERFCAGRIVVAAGAVERFQKLFSKGGCKHLYGLEVRVELEERLSDEAFYTVHGSIFAPEFFAWIVPVNGGREALIGLAASDRLYERLSGFIAYVERHGLAAPRRLVSKRSGRIVQGPPAERIVALSGSAVGIGDVLCASKPFTGGGLYAIARLAEPVARYADGYASAHELETAWKKLRRELAAQRLYTTLARLTAPSSFFGRLLRVACESAMAGKCRIDYDEHSSVVGCLLGVGWHGSKRVA